MMSHDILKVTMTVYLGYALEFSFTISLLIICCWTFSHIVA